MRRIVYLFVTALSAGCGLVIEIAAGRMIAPYLGMSLYTWTAIIAVVLAGFSVGHWIGGRLAESRARTAHAAVIWCLGAAGLSTVMALLLLKVLSGPILALETDTITKILALTCALFFLPSVFVGIPSPVLTKLALDDAPDQIGRTLGAFYAAGALGSIAGTLAAGFIFISWLGTTYTFLLVAVAYFAMAGCLLLVPPTHQPPEADQRSPDMAVTSLGLLALVALCPLALLSAWSVKPLVGPCTIESEYYCVRIVDEQPAANGRVRTLVLDHLAHSTNVEHAPRRFHSPYIGFQDTLARIHSGKQTPFRAYFIGGGAFTLPRAWLAVRPDAELTVAEIDPIVTSVARDKFWLNTADPRLNIQTGDARRILARTPPAHFDIIVGDAFQDIAIPQHLVTREFFALVEHHLREDGIFLMNVVDNQARPRLALSIRTTITRSFPTTEMWRMQSTGERSTFVMAGLRRPTPYDRLPSGSIPTVMFERVSAAELSVMSQRLSPITLTDDYSPVDRLVGTN